MINYNPVELILAKRNGTVLNEDQIRNLVEGFLTGEVPDYQMSALLMAIYFQGLNKEEIFALTKTYIESGKTITFPAELKVADKHSTGGVGDKISLMLAPIAASLGLTIPMISGRGLGHTGGTLDKLESIPGFRTQFSIEEFRKLVLEHNCALAGQSKDLVPADQKIYALRDVTATVESPGLITASILSKKIAEGAKHLIIDLKIGSGAFMPDREKAKELAELLISTGERFGLKVKVAFTNMNSPLGLAVGNGLEMIEAIEYLKGNPLKDTKILTSELTAQLLVSTNLAETAEQAIAMIEEAVKNGKALKKLEEIIVAQGGNPKVIDDYGLLSTTKYKLPILSPASGYVSHIDCRAIGYALIHINAGRMKVTDAIDHSSGALLIPKIGDFLEKDEPIGEVHCNDQIKGEEVVKLIQKAYTLSSEPIAEEPIIFDIV
ncbi:MAG TPA: thymidine phosphorylase [Candidatus Syntrophosphaera thermopropionivorans]|nr:thymidine phosphorylase [Candidatus Syntrophosphaera thermopropionivorans]